MLVADAMTMSGKVLGINRYGIVKEKPSVLARASFETPIKNIIEASMVGEVDFLNSVIENVMINQPIPTGTGLPSLVSKMRKSKCVAGLLVVYIPYFLFDFLRQRRKLFHLG